MVPKSEQERRSILQAIKTNFLFEHTSDKQRQVSSPPHVSCRRKCRGVLQP